MLAFAGDIAGERSFIRFRVFCTKTTCTDGSQYYTYSKMIPAEVIPVSDLLPLVKKELMQGHSLKTIMDSYGIIEKDHHIFKSILLNSYT